MASVTAKQMRKIAELVESTMVQPEILNRSSGDSVIEDEDDGMMSPDEIRQYKEDMDDRADQIQEASFMIMKAVRMITNAVKGTDEEERAGLYISNRLRHMATNDDSNELDSIPALINKLRNK